MRVFVAGATGAVGRRLVVRLRAAGHSVIGMTHTPARAAAIQAAGAEAAVADGLDRSAVRAAVLAAKPDVIVHEMTALGGIDMRRFDRSFRHTNRLRTEGLDHLLAAAAEAGTRRVVVQSFCGWPFARTGSPVKSEEEPLDADPPAELRRSLDAIRHLEHAALHTRGLDGLVLRYGAFYGPDTGLFERRVVDDLRRRRFPVVGGGEGWWSFLHVDDAAAATALAVARGRPGLYNIVDDEPAPVREWLPAAAAMVGAKPPRRVPSWVARFLVGRHLVVMMTEARAGANAKAKRDLGWQPAYASWRQGFAAVIAAQR